ncbi:hypothetical protein I3843_08G122600 [Carya illinoinensis]|uniref:RING-type E3 ubiquitin transferase n=1 Tax=Carya illinoinensis TaxID=32201 RepID=A0A922JCA9_CARIL|nr:hypothetical protein I3760_08G127200 [Carya illinoinensis]KAG6700747.1 hypothetical protein I3842_08G128400 [Carya illinoinensis]KAG7967880.1 hypothetical protein I3843_08G122600 [Carya illinoinensis]
MDFSNLLSFIYNLSDLREQPSLKELPSSSYKVTKWEDLEKGRAQVRFWKSISNVVCLSRLKMGQDRRTLTCLHEFHKVCVDRWFDVCRKTCPVCRFSMGGGEDNCNVQQVLTDEMVIWFSSFHVAGF